MSAVVGQIEDDDLLKEMVNAPAGALIPVTREQLMRVAGAQRIENIRAQRRQVIRGVLLDYDASEWDKAIRDEAVRGIEDALWNLKP